MPVILKHGATLLILSMFFIMTSYFFIDKSLVFWAYHHQLRQYTIFDYFTKIPLIFSVLPIIIYPYLVIRFAYLKFLAKERFLMALANSIVISVFIKDFLKLIFSRYWPITWKGNASSLLTNHAYGFNWFAMSPLNNSFPSGHVAITFAALTVIIFNFPRFRWIGVSLGLLVIIGLICDYYHFLSDIFAGAALGYLCAYYSFKFQNLGRAAS